MDNTEVYDPLDYQNLTINLVRELMTRGPYKLPLEERFTGPGVYALFYHGDFEPYKRIRSNEASHPIYVGKAVMPGARKGGGKNGDPAKNSLFGRIAQHTKSIQSATGNLRIEDFTCRYLVVVPLWVAMAERFLIEHYKPVWNVCIEGFGNHDPGSGRHRGMNSWWDALHPGRPWASKLQQSRSQIDCLARLESYFASSGQGWEPTENTVDEIP